MPYKPPDLRAACLTSIEAQKAMWGILLSAEEKLHAADKLIHDIVRPTLDDLTDNKETVYNAIAWWDFLEKHAGEPFDQAMAAERGALEGAAAFGIFGPYLGPKQRDTIRHHNRAARDHRTELVDGVLHISPSTFADGVFGMGWALMEFPRAFLGGRNRQIWRLTMGAANHAYTQIAPERLTAKRIERRREAIAGVDELVDAAVYARQVVLQSAAAELAVRLGAPPTLAAVLRYAAETEAAVYASLNPPYTRVEGVTKDDDIGL